MLNNVNLDDDAVENGRWVGLLQSKLKIAYSECEAFKTALYELDKPNISKESYCKIVSAHILKDWRDVKDPNGNDLIYTSDLGLIALMSNEPLLNFIEIFSSDIRNFASAS